MLYHVELSKAKYKIDENENLEVLIDGEWLPGSLFEENGVEMIEYDDGVCPECEGVGTTSVLQECGKTASMCCGGCYAKETCDECNGSGKLEIL